MEHNAFGIQGGEQNKDNSGAGISVRVTKAPVRQKASLEAM